MQTASMPGTRTSSKADKLLYRPLDLVVVRAPLLPVENYCSLVEGNDDLLSRFFDPLIQRAVAVGSSSLLKTFERFQNKGLNPRDTESMRAKLLRYQIRMSTRPTPFGLFAGVTLASWGAVTDLSVKSTCAATRTRPDMAWLMAFVTSIEANVAVRKRLSYCANPLAVIEADRVTLAERGPTGKGGSGPPVSVRATGAVKRALSLARKPIPYDALMAQLCETVPGATPDKVDKLLSELWEQTFLITDLRPPLTCESPARYIAERLAGIPEATDELSRLQTFLTAATAWDRMQPEESLKAFGDLLAHAGVSPDKSKETPIQVDMTMSVEGRLANAISVEATRAAELLLRLTPMPKGLPVLAAYRQNFIGRYGHDREVPLLQLLDPSRGLGPPQPHGHGASEVSPEKAARRAQTLLQLACIALHKKERVVHLDEACLSRLETWQPNAATAPRSLDINILVAARSSVEIDNGNFTVVVGPNLGAMAAGRNLARFADMLSPDGPKALKQIYHHEQAQAPDQLWAELVYLPANFRSANVVIRPPVRAYEIVLGVTPGVAASQVIPLDELVVGVDQAGFYVRWPAAGKRVVFSSGNMLTLQNAPPVGRFLIDITNDGKAVFSTFDWGMVESFPYLPRVQAGRVVLRLAQWRIQKDELRIDTPDAYRHSLDLWRATWDVPRHVFLSVGDNRLVIDLDQDSQAAELKAELKKLTEGGSLIVQEVLPQLDETWLPGPGGHYYSELTVSLVLPPSGPSSNQTGDALTKVVPASSVVAGVAEQTVSQPHRTYPPGSEWLFMKLYCPRDLEDDVISGSMLTFAENAVASGLADSWFFIRYSDPEPHLRLRFHGAPERLTRQLFAHVCNWADGLMADGLCLKFVFDTYEQEVERFGGPAGMALAEAFFSEDSRYAARLLRCANTKQWLYDRTTLVLISVDALLGAMGFDESERLRWYLSHATLGRAQTSSEYRNRKNDLRSLLGKVDFLASAPGGAEIASTFKARQEALANVVNDLRQLEKGSALDQKFDGLTASFIHLHINRLSGLSSLSEQWVLSLLYRAREGLQKSPATQ